MKTKVLFLMQLPPPVHGSSLLCSFIKDSESIKDDFDCQFLDISSESQLISIGSFKASKFIKSAAKIFSAWKSYVKFKPNLVYLALTPTGFAFYRDSMIVFILKLSGAKLVFQLHCKGLENATRTNLSKWFYRAVFKNCDVIQSDALLHDDIRNCFDQSQKAYFVANGCPDYGPSAQKSSFERPVQILYLSNYIPSKGAHVLLAALNLLPSSYNKKFFATLVGGITDQDYFNRLQVQATQKFPESIVVHGAKYGDEKNALFANSDIFVLPTAYHNECYPVSILEGMSHSAAALSTHEGAIESIIDPGINGYLFNPDKPEELTTLLCDYIDNRELLALHQRNARIKYEGNYRVEHFQQRTIDVLNDILT